MTVLKASSLPGFQRAPDKNIRAVLFYGPDGGNVREKAAGLVKSVAGALDDAFQVARLEDGQLADDPGLLADEAQSLSLMGGNRVVWVRDAGAAFLKAAEAVLAGDIPGNLIVAEAGNLDKKSKLRSVFEGAKNALIIPCYADEVGSIRDLIDQMMRAEGLAIDDDARETLAGLVGGDRLASRGEIAKLALYCMGKSRVTREDVLASCGDAAGLSVDEALDFVFGGDLREADLALERLLAAGTHPSVFLSSAARHLARLQRFRAICDQGMQVEAAVRAARPPVFFSRVRAMVRQVEIWQADELATAAATLQLAQRQTRDMPQLEDAIAARAVLSLTGLAARGRQKRY
ncbi:MAG: DNA polymerase III subunit delta [Aestuariivirgaceae bacterium]|nr:DNA polymerase III subunit delta [Aestuariivirgaceae bacterium]